MNSKIKIIYHPYVNLENKGAVQYIANSYIEGLKQYGCDVVIWDGISDPKLLFESIRPQIFIGHIRTNKVYENFKWIDIFLDYLVTYKNKNNLKVALYTHPDVTFFQNNLQLTFKKKDKSNAGDFYNQIPPPTVFEENLANSGFVDLILHPYTKLVTKEGYQFWLNKGIKVVEEPFAADMKRYKKNVMETLFKHYPVSYVGGWWPFKAIQLDKFLLPLEKAIKDDLSVFGKGWPHLSKGYISDKKYNSIVNQSKINLVFHEPSQVQGIPIHVNERIFKLYSMQSFVLCDNNSALLEYFDESEVVICSTPEEMIDQSLFYLKNRKERLRMAKKGYDAIVSRHTYWHRAKELLKNLNKI